jgi:L-asparaginase / beta-aspartyl-peptidase
MSRSMVVLVALAPVLALAGSAGINNRPAVASAESVAWAEPSPSHNRPPASVLAAPKDQPKAVLVIHGGAGVLSKEKMTPELEKQYREDLERALRAGYQAMRKEGGTSLDAVEAAIKVMEDSPRFNAGKGAVFTREGRNELDASIMEGRTKRAGAVASVTRIKNPIAAARLVMEKSEHVLMAGEGADRFARDQGLAEVSPLYFWTERRWNDLLEAHKDEERKKNGGNGRRDGVDQHYGTVGAVAVDGKGTLAAGTSTGGLTYKRAGRVGDSPIIGAGTYADNEACAVSCTGHGEIFMRLAVAHDIVARMKYMKTTVRQAAEETFRGLPKEDGGIGGFIALDPEGNFVMPFNTNGMYRGYITADGQVQIAIYDK